MENKHIHDYGENLICKICGYNLLEGSTKVRLTKEVKTAIQIIVELRKKINEDCDRALEEVLKQEE